MASGIDSQSKLNWSENPFQARYDAAWWETSRRCRASTGWICCYPGCYRLATATHHTCYADEEGPIAGREMDGVHIFGLCDRHHSIEYPDGAHNPRHWHKGVGPPPALDAWQSPEYWLLLRRGWLEKKVV